MVCGARPRAHRQLMHAVRTRDDGPAKDGVEPPTGPSYIRRGGNKLFGSWAFCGPLRAQPTGKERGPAPLLRLWKWNIRTCNEIIYESKGKGMRTSHDNKYNNFRLYLLFIRRVRARAASGGWHGQRLHGAHVRWLPGVPSRDVYQH